MKDRLKPRITFTCAKHGKQPFVAFYFAGIILGCGCGWENTSDKLIYKNCKNMWFYKYWKKENKRDCKRRICYEQ